jgi:hypothetical protein
VYIRILECDLSWYYVLNLKLIHRIVKRSQLLIVRLTEVYLNEMMNATFSYLTR